MADYYFKPLPPLQTDNPDIGLNTKQMAAVYDDNPIALSGGPGTGKSLVSLWRHILNHRRSKPVRSQLLTFTTSLALYLKKYCYTQNAIASNYVDSSKNWLYNNAEQRDEIIHDEAQDLPLHFNIDLKKYSSRVSYGADNRQLITAEARNNDGSFNINKCSPEEELWENFKRTNILHELSRNYRNSKKIMELTKHLFGNLPKGPSIPKEIIDSCKEEGEFPRLIITGHILNRINETVIQLINDFSKYDTTNIGILVPFERYGPQINRTATVNYYFNLLQSHRISCSKYTNEMNGCEDILNIHITTFKSAKGLEFDVVILPDFNLLLDTFNVVDWRDYYVGVTRTKSNLFLLSRSDLPNIPAIGSNKVIEKVII